MMSTVSAKTPAAWNGNSGTAVVVELDELVDEDVVVMMGVALVAEEVEVEELAEVLVGTVEVDEVEAVVEEDAWEVVELVELVEVVEVVDVVEEVDEVDPPAFRTFTLPVMNGWMVQKYAYVPAVVNVCV
jgi:hypothetical protein